MIQKAERKKSVKKEEKEIKEKKRRGDRKDAWLVRGLDSIHYIMPYNLPKRTDNEAVLTETIDLTAIEEYLKKKNVEGIDFKYTFFFFIKYLSNH